MKKIFLIIVFLIFTHRVWATSGCNFFTDEINVTPTSYEAWVDVDVSSYVPEGATGAILRLANGISSTQALAVRKNGSTDTKTGIITQSGHFGAMVGLDSNRKFEAHAQTSTANIYLIGYTTDGTDFLTNAVEITPASTGSWVDVDVSANVPVGATGVIVEIMNESNDGTHYHAGVRMHNSTDTFTYGSPYTYSRYLYQVCGVDSNRILEAQVDSTTLIAIWLVGYFKSPITFETNAVSYALSSIGSWLDITVSSGNAPANADGALWIIKTNNATRSGGTRKNGSGDTSTGDMPGGAPIAFFTGLDENRKAEGYISNTDVDHYVIGYAQPVTPQPALIQDAKIKNAKIQ